METRVEFAARRTRVPSPASQELRVRGNYRLTTRLHERGLQIDFDEFAFTAESVAPGASDLAQQLMGRFAAIVPSYVVSPEGVLVDLVRLDEMQAGIRSEIEALLARQPRPASPEVRAQVDRLVQAVTSRAALRRSVEEDWARDVGQWIGAELEYGRVYTTAFRAPSPLLPDLTLAMVAEFSCGGPTACREGLTAQGCVKLRVTTAPEPQSLASFMKAWAARFGIQAPRGFEMKMTTVIDLVTEPDTLLPHSMHELKTVRLLETDGRPTEQVDERLVTYTYTKR
jgi:hypothetical protein